MQNARDVLRQFEEILADGRWHSIREIAEKTGIDEAQVLALARFYNAFHFAVIVGGMVKLAPAYLNLMFGSDECWEETLRSKLSERDG